jgi:hypothetical protein
VNRSDLPDIVIADIVIAELLHTLQQLSLISFTTNLEDTSGAMILFLSSCLP